MSLIITILDFTIKTSTLAMSRSIAIKWHS